MASDDWGKLERVHLGQWDRARSGGIVFPQRLPGLAGDDEDSLAPRQGLSCRRYPARFGPGQRGIRPPFPAVVGLWGGPTVINNVETLAGVPHIILKGGQWYADLGPPKNGGTRLFCLSGHVRRPGVYELPLGYNLKKMIYEVAGGIPDGHELKAVVPGGSSTPLLASNEIDVAMDFDTLLKAGTFLGSGGVVVVDETMCMVKFALRIMKFYQHESCGWCIPCREGTDWLKKNAQPFS